MTSLLGVPTLVAGLVLRYADNPQWFDGAHAVGHILILVSAAVIALGLLVSLAVLGLAAAASRPAYRRPPSPRPPRRRF